MQIRPYNESFRSAWDQYVAQHAEGTLFHTTGWMRAIERAFGYEPRYLLAEEGRQICGVLPLFVVSNCIQGRTLISTPFAVYGGICASDETTRQALAQAACQMAREAAVEYLELREQYQSFGDGFLTKDLYVTFDQELPQDSDRLLVRLAPATRNKIRKAQKQGLRAVTDNAQLDLFYEVFADSVRRLGTPVFPRRFFHLLREELGDALQLTVVWHGQRAIAGVLCFRFGGRLLSMYSASLEEGRNLAANNFVYWEILKQACQRGVRYFDFGRSKVGTGAYLFKVQWNMQERPLPYQYFLVRRKTMPNFSPTNSRFKPAIELWKHIPLPLTKVLGPALVRLFP